MVEKKEKPPENKAPVQPKKPLGKSSSNLTQKQMIGIALLVIGVILIGIAILTW